MRISSRQPTGKWNGQTERGAAGAVSLEWRQEWFANLCLAVILAALLILMSLSIYLVLTKPAPVSIPGGTVIMTGGAAFAEAGLVLDEDVRIMLLRENALRLYQEAV